MSAIPRIVSVNAGAARPLRVAGGRTLLSGIRKTPVAGPALSAQALQATPWTGRPSASKPMPSGLLKVFELSMFDEPALRSPAA